MSAALLEVIDLHKQFRVRRGVPLLNPRQHVHAVDGVSFAIARGETFGIVGESGCGKTTLARVILLLEAPTSGEVRFDGRSVGGAGGAALRGYRRAVQAVFQDPTSALSPRMRVGDIVGEPMRATGRATAAERRAEVERLLRVVGLRENAAAAYPHEFSGGQRQRIAIARALSTRPQLIVLDEPISALDISIRAQIMNLLRDIQDETGTAFLLIAHDLAVVKHMSTHVGVMYLGKLVETGPADVLYRRPLHPYTKALLAAALPSRPDDAPGPPPLSGELPSPLAPPSGCRFRTRCPLAIVACADAEPPLRVIDDSQQVACIRA
jgi:oligopeptide/dipeptide ABC transporter ATP-binding protein